MSARGISVSTDTSGFGDFDAEETALVLPSSKFICDSSSDLSDGPVDDEDVEWSSNNVDHIFEEIATK
jgi:hypothetical protein